MVRPPDREAITRIATGRPGGRLGTSSTTRTGVGIRVGTRQPGDPAAPLVTAWADCHRLLGELCRNRSVVGAEHDLTDAPSEEPATSTSTRRVHSVSSTSPVAGRARRHLPTGDVQAGGVPPGARRPPPGIQRPKCLPTRRIRRPPVPSTVLHGCGTTVATTSEEVQRAAATSTAKVVQQGGLFADDAADDDGHDPTPGATVGITPSPPSLRALWCRLHRK